MTRPPVGPVPASTGAPHVTSPPVRLPTHRAADPLAECIGGFLRRAVARRASDATVDAALAALSQRLDDRGCASGRVTVARVDDLNRAFDRLEAKLNAILVAVTATLLSTLLGLGVVALRASVGLP